MTAIEVKYGDITGQLVYLLAGDGLELGVTDTVVFPSLSGYTDEMLDEIVQKVKEAIVGGKTSTVDIGAILDAQGVEHDVENPTYLLTGVVEEDIQQGVGYFLANRNATGDEDTVLFMVTNSDLTGNPDSKIELELASNLQVNCKVSDLEELNQEGVTFLELADTVTVERSKADYTPEVEEDEFKNERYGDIETTGGMPKTGKKPPVRKQKADSEGKQAPERPHPGLTFN